MAKPQAKQLVVCVENEGCGASLERQKIYVLLRHAQAEKHGLLRVVDEFGDDYLYPKAFFCLIALPQAVKKESRLVRGVSRTLCDDRRGRA